MKKIIIYILIAYGIISLGVTGYLFYKNIYQKPIPGTTPQTTGAVSNSDKNTADSFNQVVRLSSLGKINLPEFKIDVSQYGDITITLSPPYDTSKQKALDWLKNNGFDLITENKIVFTESP